MFAEQGAFELIFLAAVALIVVGPKDLPVLMRKVGQFTAKMRGLAAEFRASFDEMARQSELDELRKEVEALKRGVTAPDIHEMMGAGPVKRDLEQHWDELHHGLTPASSTTAHPDSAASPDSVSGGRETGDPHSVHSVHPVSSASLTSGPDSADSPDSVSEAGTSPPAHAAHPDPTSVPELQR